jgi:hypothetical protein
MHCLIKRIASLFFALSCKVSKINSSRKKNITLCDNVFFCATDHRVWAWHKKKRFHAAQNPKIPQKRQKRHFLDILDKKGCLEKNAVSLSQRASSIYQTKADTGGCLEIYPFLCGRSLVPEPLPAISILDPYTIYNIFKNIIYIYIEQKFFLLLFCYCVIKKASKIFFLILQGYVIWKKRP